MTSDEFDIIKKHTVIGAEILDNSKSNILMIARQIALSHHEKWNGGGYPHGLNKDAIPLSARIVALADTFDVLISKRSYKEPFPVSIAFEIIKSEREKHFDPDVVDVFEKNLEEIMMVNSALGPEDTSGAILKVLGS